MTRSGARQGAAATVALQPAPSHKLVGAAGPPVSARRYGH